MKKVQDVIKANFKEPACSILLHALDKYSSYRDVAEFDEPEDLEYCFDIPRGHRSNKEFIEGLLDGAYNRQHGTQLSGKWQQYDEGYKLGKVAVIGDGRVLPKQV